MNDFSWTALLDRLSQVWESFRSSLPEDWFSRRAAGEIVRYTRPVEPFNGIDLLTPIIGLAGLLAGLVLSGVALASLGWLLASLLALGFLLTEVYGVTLEVEGFPPRP